MRKRAIDTQKGSNTAETEVKKACRGSSASDGDNNSSAKKDEFLESLADRFAKRQAPARLTAFIHDPRLEISSRIYNEVVIRMPIDGLCEDLVLGFARSFGPVEYLRGTGQTKKERMEKSFGVAASAAASSESVSVADSPKSGDSKTSPKDDYCHYLQFSDPRDAMRCVLELNGFIIDPEEENNEQTRAVQAVQQQLSSLRTQAQIENEGAAESVEESALWDELDAAIRDRESHQRFVPVDEGAKLVVVTCDFFRCAFLENMGGVAKCMLAQGNPQRRVLVGKKGESVVDPVRSQQLWLRSASHELLQVYGLVRSHEIEWDDFMFAVNYFSFFFDHRGTAALQKKGRSRLDELQWAPWLVVLESLRHVQYRTTSFLKWLDVCSTEEELLSGAKTHLIGQPAVLQAQALMQRGRQRGCLWSLSMETLLVCALSFSVVVLTLLLYLK